MITRCSEPRQAAEILSYLGEDYKKVPYLYVNLTHYGVSDENVKTWKNHGGGCLFPAFTCNITTVCTYIRRTREIIRRRPFWTLPRNSARKS